MTTKIPCSRCEKSFKTGGGLHWHLTHAHRAAHRSAPQRVLPCSDAAMRLIIKVVETTGLPVWEAVDLLVAAALDNDIWESMLDTWDASQTDAQNAPYWLPLRAEDYQGLLAS